MSNEPRTLIEAVRHFADPEVTHELIVSLRWPTGVHCPTCGRTDVRFISTRRLWECKEKHPKRQFSAKVGTIFEDSPLSLDKWFVAIWAVANCKNGISSYELGRALGVQQRTGWFMLHRIRLAMKAGSLEWMAGDIEADETFVGGLSKNMHAHKRTEVIKKRRGPAGKTVVLGILRRTSKKASSKVKARVVENVKRSTLQGEVRATVEPGSTIHTDAWIGYRGLDDKYVHEVIDHTIEYVRGRVHTNGIENFWSLLKRTIKGTYVNVEPFHLTPYVDEQVFRFNERDDNDHGRFRKVLQSVFGLRLTYKELTGNDGATATA
jgi:transposase-like protein